MLSSFGFGVWVTDLAARRVKCGGDHACMENYYWTFLTVRRSGDARIRLSRIIRALDALTATLRFL